MRMKPYICDRLNKEPSEWNKKDQAHTVVQSDSETKLIISPNLFSTILFVTVQVFHSKMELL